MRRWETEKQTGLLIGAGILVFVIALDVALIWWAVVRRLDIVTFLIGVWVLISLTAAGIIGYWVYGLARSVYLLDRNALVIQWGPIEQTIPTQDIERVMVGEDLEGDVRFLGVRWPGLFVGYGEVPDAGETLFYGTQPPEEQLYIVTPGLTYGISPQGREEFVEALDQRIRMGPTQIVEHLTRRPRILDWEFWQDRLGLILLGAGIVALVALTGFLCLRFPAFPDQIAMRFDPQGNPYPARAKGNLFILPLIGLLALSVNGVLGFVVRKYEPLVSYLLWGGSVLVQILVWAATVNILLQA